MVLVVFERHVFVGCFGNVMFECFCGVMFGCIYVRDYGGMGWNHMYHRGYSKMWWRHMVVVGKGHALGFVFGCVTRIGYGVGCMWIRNHV